MNVLNTTNYQKTLPPKRQGQLGTTRAKNASANANIEFSITRVARDQDECVWAEVSFNKKSCWISLATAGESETYLFQKLRGIGVNIVSASAKTTAKNALQDATPDGDILVAKQPGYFFTGTGETQKLHAFAYPSGQIIHIPNEQKPEILIGFELNEKFVNNGDVAEFQKGMGVLVKDQAIPVLMLTMALVPILQQFTPPGLFVENIIVELCGTSTTGKSAVAIGLAGAVWGGNPDPNSKTGFFDTWNSTPNRIEERLINLNNTLMGLDEATAISGNAKQRAELIGNLVHRLSLGQTKQRMGDSSAQSFRLVTISTSNQSLSSICEESPSIVEALETRIVTVNIPDRSTKIFDFLPRGFRDIDKARSKFYVVGCKHFGHIAPKMIAKTLKKYGEDPDELQKRIGKLMRSFMKYAGFDSFDSMTKRRFTPFALAYAAGVLAKEWKVLDQKLFGKFKAPLLRAWRMTAKNPQVNPRERYLAYLLEHSDKIRVVKSRAKTEMTDGEFNKTKAFIVKMRDGQRAVAFPPHFMGQRFNGFESDFRKMRDLGWAITDRTGLQTKHRIRLKNGEVKNDRVYMIRLDQWPLA